MKWLWWAAVLGVVIWLARGGRAPARGTPAARPSDANGNRETPAQSVAAESPRRAATARDPHRIVPCAHCGLHLPADEAIASPIGNDLYCSEAHRLEHVARQRQATRRP